MGYMSTDEILQTVSSSSKDTFDLGEKLGQKCKGSEVFVLQSDLGGGKTILTQGLAKGLGIQDHVTSPTFTISRVYKGRDNLHLYHFDFYRLHDPGIIKHELAEVALHTHSVTVIEWGDIVNSVIPKDAIVITLDRRAETEDSRLISMKLPTSRSYLRSAE